METLKLNLNEKQMKKLAMGGGVMIGPEMMEGGAIECTLNPSKCERMRANHAAGKKYRLTMDAAELKGGSFASFMRGLKKAAKATGRFIKKGAKAAWNVWQKDYKPTYGPKIRAGLKDGLDAGLQTLAAMTGQPEAVAIAKVVATQLAPLVDRLGDFTNAFGMRKGTSEAAMVAAGLRERLKGVMEEAMAVVDRRPDTCKMIGADPRSWSPPKTLEEQKAREKAIRAFDRRCRR